MSLRLIRSTLSARTLIEMVLGVGKNMAGSSIEQKAIGLLQAFEKAGKSVSRVMIDGRKIELVLEQSKAIDEFDRIDMRHDKT
jgi:predicted metalloenzyme YecM